MMRAWRERRLVAVLLLAAFTASADELTDELSRAFAARTAGDYRTAIVLLEKVLAAAPDRDDLRLTLAETLAWDKRLPEAEALYRKILAGSPLSRDGRLGLARVLLWEGRYGESRQMFDELLAANPRDVESAEGGATAAYWSADFRTAARCFEQVLALDPSREFSRTSLDQIRRRSAPDQRLEITFVDDDQPYRLVRSALTGSISSDPLTRWSAAAGAFRTESSGHGLATEPFLSLANETGLPSLGLTVNAELGALRYADAAVRPVGQIALTRRMSSRNRVTARAEQRELLATATSLQSHPHVATYAFGWRYEGEERWLAAAEAATLRYFDGNRGTSAYAYVLAPLVSREHVHFHAGVSASIRDTRESRFTFAGVSSLRTGTVFDYSYRGEYAPYWAPQRLREGRAVAVVEAPLGTATVKLHVDGGIAHDRAISFGPASGTSPLPGFIYSFPFDRTSHPLRTAVSVSVPLRDAFRAEFAYENSTTAFYRAKNFHALLVRHR